MTHEIVRATQMLVDIRFDYQMDPNHEGYLGFVNVGAGVWVGDAEEATWAYIVEHERMFRPIINELGLKIEGRMGLDETIFALKK